MTAQYHTVWIILIDLIRFFFLIRKLCFQFCNYKQHYYLHLGGVYINSRIYSAAPFQRSWRTGGNEMPSRGRLKVLGWPDTQCEGLLLAAMQMLLPSYSPRVPIFQKVLYTPEHFIWVGYIFVLWQKSSEYKSEMIGRIKDTGNTGGWRKSNRENSSYPDFTDILKSVSAFHEVGIKIQDNFIKISRRTRWPQLTSGLHI